MSNNGKRVAWATRGGSRDRRPFSANTAGRNGPHLAKPENNAAAHRDGILTSYVVPGEFEASDLTAKRTAR